MRSWTKNEHLLVLHMHLWRANKATFLSSDIIAKRKKKQLNVTQRPPHFKTQQTRMRCGFLND